MKIAAAFVLALLLSHTFVTGAEPGEKGERKKPKLSAETLSGLKFRNIGPALMSGRISDLAVDPAQPEHLVRRGGVGQSVEDDQRRHDVDADLRALRLLFDWMRHG